MVDVASTHGNRPLSEVKDQLPALLERYLAGESGASLAREVNVNQSSLSRALLRMGAPGRSEVESERLAVECAAVVELYRKDVALEEIASELGISKATVQNHLSRSEEPRRPRGASRVARLPDDVLTMEWALSEAGSWACGLIVTDGSLRVLARSGERSNESPRLRVVLQEQDRPGLELLAQAFGLSAFAVGSTKYRYTTDAGEMRESTGACLEFTHHRLRFLVDELGMPLGDKTVTACLPEALVGSRHAWRGVFDGDGWASVQKTEASLPWTALGLVSASPTLGSQYEAYLRSRDLEASVHVREPVSHRRSKSPHAQAVLYAEPAARMADELYRDCMFTIPRKRDKAWAVREARLGKPGRAPSRPRVRPEEVQEWRSSFEDGTTLAEISRSSRRSRMTIEAHLRRVGVLL